MATRAATFTSKIRNLKDYHYRIMNAVPPQPTGVDIANTLKYFSQTLLSVLKDVPDIPAESFGPRQRDSVRLAIFPNLNYSGLYKAVLNIIDIVPMLQLGQLALGESVLNLLGCLVPFLEYDLLDSLPYNVASTLAIFPSSLHKDTIELLCSNLIPMTLGFDGCLEPSYASESAAAIMTMVFQHTENDAFHTQIVETLMGMKTNFCKDLISVIAYGPPVARPPAVNLLFYYWPQLNPGLSDRRGLHYKYSGESTSMAPHRGLSIPRMSESSRVWAPVLCQRERCLNSRNCQAVKMCLNPALAIQSGDKPPPLYICTDCVDELKRDHAEYMVDILQPMAHASMTCENKNCTSESRLAVCTCFSIECASYNGNRPIRYCKTCHEIRHSSLTGQAHVFHTSIPDMGSCPPDMQRYLMDAIVSLLKEAQPIESKRLVEMGEEHRRFIDEDDFFDAEDAEDRKLLSRYGIWLLVELCQNCDDVPIEILGRLLGMLFQWFDATAYLPDDNIGNALERLKPAYICHWLKDIADLYFELIVSCLLPHPVEYARVGGYWDTLANRTTQIKEGMNRLFCLVPYDIITFEIWDYAMPYWLEAIRTEVPTEQLHELKVLLSKAFDIDMCPLPFNLDKMYHFVSERFAEHGAYVQDQALQWLQILSRLDIIIPMHQLFSMFKAGVHALLTISSSTEGGIRDAYSSSLLHAITPTEESAPPLSPEHCIGGYDQAALFDRETALNLPCFIMMLDLMLKQMELQECPEHLGIYNEMSVDIMQLITMMLSQPYEGTHQCSSESGDSAAYINCLACQNSVLWHKLVAELLGKVLPRDPVKLPTKDLPKVEEMAALQQKAAKPGFINKNKSDIKTPASIPEGDSVDHSDGEMMFDTEKMPYHLRLFNVFIRELNDLNDSDAMFSLLNSLKFLCLHGECLNYTVSQYEEFLKYKLDTVLIPGIWRLLRSDNSHLATIAVPLLLHCMTLPSGADVLWKLVEQHFTSDDWKVRFSAVEKVTVLARHLEPGTIKINQIIQTTLAHTFSSLIGSLEDINASVAQKTIIYLETIKPACIKCLCQCMEFQFDSVISDRLMILHRTQLLANALKKQPILTWDFFLFRFDTLSLEAQIDLENSGDIAFATDLTSSNRESESFMRKLNRARFALARTDTVRSLSQALQGKPPYRRTVSAPLQMMARASSVASNTTPNTAPASSAAATPSTGLPKAAEKEKVCVRQQSAPQFRTGRRMTAGRFGGLGSFGSFMFPGGQLREFTDEESNFAALLQRAMDLEGVDRETVHELVALLMRFMVHVDQDATNDDKRSFKSQNIVLRHLNVLLGYNQTEKAFSVPPYKLRSSAVFNAFVSGLPHVLDRNFALGNMILPISLLLLQYSPSPQRYASDYQPPTYTLWYLEPHTRQSWLMAMLVILYKYQINSTPVSTIITTLIKIVTNTIDSQHHHCKKAEDGFPPGTPAIPPRNRDASKVSATDLENIQETDTPPDTPTGSSADLLNIELRSPATASLIHFRRKLKMDGMSEDGSDADSSTVSPLQRLRSGLPKKTVSKLHIQRVPRRLADYALVESEDEKDDGKKEKGGSKKEPQLKGFKVQSIKKEKIMSLHVKLPPKSPLQSYQASLQSSVSVESKMVEQIREFEEQTEAKKSVSPPPQPLIPRTGVKGESGCDQMSEAESVEESEKTQTTSDPESEKHTTKTDSADYLQDEPKDESQEKAPVSSKPHFRQRKARKTGLTTVELQRIFPDLDSSSPPATDDGSATSATPRSRKSELLSKVQVSSGGSTKKPMSRYSECLQVERCPECNAILEQYDDETIGLGIVVLATFIHREPTLATPVLLEMLQCVSRIAGNSSYSWQSEGLIVPGNCVSIARQFLRCTLHQMAPNGIFPMLFLSNMEDSPFFKTMANALVDFNELTCHAPLQFLLEGLNNKKNLPAESIMLLLSNLATYLSCITLETNSPMWSNILMQFDLFFRRLPSVLPNPCDVTPLLKIMTAVLKIPGIATVRSILEPFSKLLSFAIQNSNFKLQFLLDICSLGNRAFSKERDKLFLTRCVVFEFIQALRFRTQIPDENWLLLVQFMVLDCGGTILQSNIGEDLSLLYQANSHTLISTCATECLRQYLNDCMEFIMDLHTLTKVKNNMKGGSSSLNEDTLGSHLKSGIAQYIALEISKGNGRDNRAITRYLPWLYHPPSAMQQGPKEFTDCVGHIRLLSWLLIGSLTHTAVTEGMASIVCQPVPLEASCHIADHVLVIMTGFAEQSKASVLHMSSLFHAFILCQLWTMYCESASALQNSSSNGEPPNPADITVMDFWGRVTPGILQLLSHSKVLAEMVNLHFLSLMEALQECNSSVLAKLFPMWIAILYSYHAQLPGHLQVRLQTCRNWEPPQPGNNQGSFNSNMLLAWLKRIQFKLGQIEVQSSAATQFYTV